MMNDALAAAFAVFVAAVGLGVPQATHPAPFFIYNPVTQFISLIAHNTWIQTLAQQQDPAAVNIAKISMNSSLYIFVDGVDCVYTKSPAVPYNTQQDVLLIVADKGDNGYPTNTYPTLPTYLAMQQNYNTINYWTSLRKLVITSNHLPIRSESIPTGDVTTGQSSARPILADFVPDLTLAGQSRSIAYYYPDAQYKLVDMMQDGPLQKIDLTVYWEDKDSNLYPLYISRYQQASIKLGFFKKATYGKLIM